MSSRVSPTNIPKSSQQVVILGNKTGFFKGWVPSLVELWNARELLFQLSRREIKTKYKNSSLGFLWSFAKPLALLLIYFVAVGQFLGAARSIPDFAIFMFSGFIIWSLFSDIISSATNSIVSNAGLVKKIYVPRELFPLSASASSFTNFAIQLGLLLVFGIFVGSIPLVGYIGSGILGFICISTFSLGIGLLLSAWNVFLRDIQHIVEIALMVLFWCSPIVYSVGLVREVLGEGFLFQIYLANPITISVLGMQRAIWSAGDNLSQYWPNDLDLRLMITSLLALLILFLSQRIFSKLEGNFAQEL